MPTRAGGRGRITRFGRCSSDFVHDTHNTIQDCMCNCKSLCISSHTTWRNGSIIIYRILAHLESTETLLACFLTLGDDSQYIEPYCLGQRSAINRQQRLAECNKETEQIQMLGRGGSMTAVHEGSVRPETWTMSRRSPHGNKHQGLSL